MDEKEHVTLRLYEKVGLYKCKFIDPPLKFRNPEIRLTLDYEEDYILLKKLFSFKKNINLSNVISLYKNNRKLFEINKHCVQTKLDRD